MAVRSPRVPMTIPSSSGIWRRGNACRRSLLAGLYTIYRLMLSVPLFVLKLERFLFLQHYQLKLQLQSQYPHSNHLPLSSLKEGMASAKTAHGSRGIRTISYGCRPSTGHQSRPLRVRPLQVRPLQSAVRLGVF